jgi:hypothetical protein
MKLLNEERLIFGLSTATGKLSLTSLRIFQSSESEFTSIRLEDVSSVSVVQLTHRWLLWMTGACITIAASLVWMASQGAAFLGMENYRIVASLLLFVSAILVMAFGTKRFTQVRVAANTATIEVRVRSMARSEIIRFVRELEEAKNARYRQIGHLSQPKSA